MRGAPSEEANTPKSSWRSFGEWRRSRRRSSRKSADVASPVRILIVVEWEPVMVFCAACADSGLISMAVQLRVFECQPGEAGMGTASYVEDVVVWAYYVAEGG